MHPESGPCSQMLPPLLSSLHEPLRGPQPQLVARLLHMFFSDPSVPCGLRTMGTFSTPGGHCGNSEMSRLSPHCHGSWKKPLTVKALPDLESPEEPTAELRTRTAIAQDDQSLPFVPTADL